LIDPAALEERFLIPGKSQLRWDQKGDFPGKGKSFAFPFFSLPFLKKKIY
jgi:hypothetical protein